MTRVGLRGSSKLRLVHVVGNRCVSPPLSDDFLPEESAEPARLRPHPFAVVEHDRLGEVLAPAVLVVDRATKLRLRFPCGRNAGPVLRGAEDVLCLRERDEGEVEASGFPVKAREVQERPATPLEMGAIVLAVKPIEGVEQERFGPFRVVPVRREYAGREERLSNDAGIAGLLGVVQAGIEGAAGVVPAAEFHQRVAAAEQGEGAHRRIGRRLREFRVEVGGLRPPQAALFLDALMERGLERLQVHPRPENRTARFVSLCPDRQSVRATSSTAATIRSTSAGPTPGWTGSSKRPGITSSATGHRPRIFRSRRAFCLYSGIGYDGRQPIPSSVRSWTISSRDRGNGSSSRTMYW